MKQKILFVISLLFGLMYINSGLNKLFHYIPVPKDMPEAMVRVMAAFTEIGWLMPLIAVVEIIAGVLVITKRYSALGALMLFPITVGILFTHIINIPSGLPIAIVLMLINLWIIFENREKYLPIVK